MDGEAVVAVRAQAQVDVVECAGGGAAGQPCGQAVGQSGVGLPRFLVGVVKQVDQIQVGCVAEFFAAEFAVADDGEGGFVAVFFRHLLPCVLQGLVEYDVGQMGELVADGFNRPSAGQVLYGQSEGVGVVEVAQGVHFGFGIVAGGQGGGQFGLLLRPVGSVVGQLRAQEFVQQDGVLLQVGGYPRALAHEFGHAGEFVGVFEQEGEIGRAAADGFEKVGQARQGFGRAACIGGGLDDLGHKCVETGLAARRQAAVARAQP